MRCKHCGTELARGAKFCPECGTSAPTSGDVKVDQKARDVQGDVTGLVAGEGAEKGALDANVTQDVDRVAEGGTVTGAVLGAEGSHTHVGGTEYHRNKREIRTGGGAYVGGNVTVNGGDFVGRDQIVYHASPDAADLARRFAQVYRQIKARPMDPDVDKDEVVETVKKIEQEAAQGAEANPKKVERWLKTLAMMAPDILEVTVAALIDPASGIAAVVRNVAERLHGSSRAHT